MFKIIKTAAEIQAETGQQAKKQRITELKRLLAETDFKFNIDYDEQDTSEWNQLKDDRQAWREEIRQLEKQ